MSSTLDLGALLQVGAVQLDDNAAKDLVSRERRDRQTAFSSLQASVGPRGPPHASLQSARQGARSVAKLPGIGGSGLVTTDASLQRKAAANTQQRPQKKHGIQTLAEADVAARQKQTMPGPQRASVHVRRDSPGRQKQKQKLPTADKAGATSLPRALNLCNRRPSTDVSNTLANRLRFWTQHRAIGKGVHSPVADSGTPASPSHNPRVRQRGQKCATPALNENRDWEGT